MLSLTCTFAHGKNPYWVDLQDGYYIDKNSRVDGGVLREARLRHANGSTHIFEFDCNLKTMKELSALNSRQFKTGENLYLDRALEYACASKLKRLFK